MSDENIGIIKAVLDTVERFASREISDEINVNDKYPYSEYASKALKGAAEAGLLLTTVPENFGGTGMPPTMWARILEKVAYVDSGFAASLMAHAMALQAVLDHGDEALIGEVVEKAPLAYPLYHQAGEKEKLPVVSVSGVDVTTIEGVATMCANGPVAERAVIVALKGDTLCLCLIELTDLSRPEPVEMLGLRSCPVGHIDMDGVDPSGVSILAEGDMAVKSLHDAFYPSATAIILSTLKSSMDYAIEYGTERYQGGTSVANHGQVRSMYSKMMVEFMSLKLAWRKAIEPDCDDTSRMALKILAAEHAVRATTDGVQLLGGYGYTMEYPQERRMRDARQASELLGSPPRQRMALINNRLGG